METLIADLRFGLRLMAKKPGFALIAIVTLALGIGANTAIFSVVNSVLLRPLPYPEPERLATFQLNQSVPDLDDIKNLTQSFDYIGGTGMQPLDYTGGDEPIQVRAWVVNGELFDALGVRAAMGRTISTQEDRFGGERTVVLSHAFWQQHLGGDAGVLGRTIPLGGQSYEVIGVMPEGFKTPREEADLWVSVRVAQEPAARARGVHFFRTYLRLKQGVTLAEAQAEMENIDRWLEQQYPSQNKNRHSVFIPLQERVVGSSRPALLILFGAVGLVLLIACANFANLLLARAASRQQEIVIRAALGAARRRLMRQMITESALLACIGGAAGLVLAQLGIKLLIYLKPANLPRLAEVSLDSRVLAFTFGTALLTGIIFGLAPAITASKFDVNQALKESGRATATKQRLRSALVIAETAIAIVLLAGAGLLIKSFWLLGSVDPGFKPEKVLTMRIDLPQSRYRDIPLQTAFRRNLLEKLNATPGIEAAIISEVPLSGDDLTHNFIILGRPPLAEGEEPELPVRSIAGDYFRVMNIPLIEGRDISEQDREGMPIVGVVNQSFVRQYFPNENPIGAHITWAQDPRRPSITIVGVVGDVKHYGLNEPEQPAFYYSYMQLEQPWKRWMSLVVRSNSEEAIVLDQVKAQIRAIDNQIPVTKVQTMKEVMAASIAAQRFNVTLMSVFASVALALAVVGIYGVVSYSVTQRTREIGIRSALGASRTDVLSLVLRQGLWLTLAGLATGLAAAIAATRLMSTLLYGVSATDPVTFILVSVLLAGVALGACFVPARRAAKVDPMIALRYE
ncbi:MAG TPA: ABC transporter permease [Blastocatellia bacterium]